VTESELLSAVESETRQSLGYMGGLLSDQRRQAMDYYYGAPFGDEQPGQSAVVSTDVADTVESVLPQIVKIFTSADEIVRFEAQGPEDEDAAAQATDYLNYLFFRQNKGFVTTYSAIKDGLLQKNCFAKVYWDTYADYETETYENLSEDEMALLLQDSGEIEILEHSAQESMDPLSGAMMVSYAVRLRKKREKGRVCVESVPPEEFLVNRGAGHDIQKARFVAHRCKKTASELRLMGYDPEGLSSDEDGWLNEERQARFGNDEEFMGADTDPADESMREIWVTEAYMRVDYDGDGIAELRKITTAGHKILDNEEMDRIPFVTGTPILMPHKLFGRSVADLVMDLQLIKSTVLRQILDNMYLTNHSRVQALDGMVNFDDLLTVRPGGVVRVKAFNAIAPLPVQVMGAPAFQLVEYLDSVREVRTGVTRYNQGLDADSLNKTATGIGRIMDASMERILLIARIFAETFFADLFWSMLELVCKHETQERTVKLRNKWVTVNPREWKNRFNMSISVGLGTGSQQDLQQGVLGLLQVQERARQGGARFVTEQNAYYAALAFAKLVDPKRADMYFTNPSELPPPEPQPDPKIVTTQMKIDAQAEQRAKKMAQDREMEHLRMGSDILKSMGDKEHEKEMAVVDHALGMDRAAADYEADGYRNGQT
jgi:hypothetical protein